MNEYTYSQIKKNKRQTISILIAITIASALLCSICIFSHSFWKGKINDTIGKTGDWHGELWEATTGSDLKKVEDNPEIEATMIKGQWVTAKLDSTKRPYYLMRGADKQFWHDMNFKNTIIEGRLPEKEGEMVVSKLFFIENPSYKVGDQLTLPIGNRMLEGKELQTNEYKKEGEYFQQVATKDYTIVGNLDISGGSAFPGYIAMDYLEKSKIQPADDLTIYMRFKKPSTIYKNLPLVAESVGLEKDETGNYGIVYNTPLLSLYGISDEGFSNPQFIVVLAMGVVLLILVVGTFVLIIYNAFSLSSNSRTKELSILKSLGATPKQIKHSVLYEGFILWLLQSPIGVLIGYGFSYLVIDKVNGILQKTANYSNMTIEFSWLVVVFSLMISLVTVLISAYIPARRMSKIPAVEGINQNHVKIKNKKNYLIASKVFGIEGEIAKRQSLANKKSLRTAMVSLSLCLILIISYLNIISIYNFAESKNTQLTNYDMTVNLNIMDEPDNNMVQKIMSLPEIQKNVIRRKVRTTTSVKKTQESVVFSELGGFSSVSNSKYNIVKDDNNFKIVVNLVGLDNESFKTYCQDINVDYEKYYVKDEPLGILEDNTYHQDENSKDVQKIAMLNIKSGSSMEISEKEFASTDGDYKFSLKIGDTTDKIPGEFNSSRYSVSMIIPMERYEQIVSHFSPERILETNMMSIDLLVGERNANIAKEKMETIINNYLGSEDYSIWSLKEDKEHDELVQKSISIIIYAIAIMIGFIGIFNTISTISNNLQIHKREYAMLRSVGITPSGLNKVLLLEGISFALKPIILSIPIVFLISGFMLNLTSTTWGEFVLISQKGIIIFYILCMFLSIFLVYWNSSKKLKRENIIDSIKNEVI